MTDMRVSVESGSGLERRMKVEIPATRIEQEIDTRLTKVRRNAKLKGFRPGKVSPKVIRERYGMQVRQEVLQDMIQSSYSTAIQQENLRPAAMPTIEPGDGAEGEDFAFTAVFEVYPDVAIAGLDKLKIARPETEIAEQDVDEMVETLRKQRADWAPVERKAGDGDRVTIDFEGTLKGETFDGGAGTDVPIVIGQGQMLEDFEKNLKGLKAGDEKTFKMKFPKDYHASDLAGQKVEFAVTAKEVAEEVLPEIDEEFVKTFGVASGGVEQFRADVRNNMEREAAARNKAEIKRQVMEQLLDANPIDVPGTLVDQEAVSLRRESLRNMGITDENDPNLPSVDQFRDAGERRVRLGLLVAALVQDNDLEVDRELVKAKVDEVVSPYDDPDEIRKMYFQNPQLMAQVENVVLEEQVIAWLVDKATVTAKKVAFSELMAES
ncbi:MAG: trigger factor [Gammaproteobacteria bacterium]|nr:trigger factor [Gammaproteobacteria bacterium]